MTIDQQLTPIISELLDSGVTLEQATEAFERKMIDLALKATAPRRRRMSSLLTFNVTEASKKLGVHRNTLHNKLRAMKGWR